LKDVDQNPVVKEGVPVYVHETVVEKVDTKTTLPVFGFFKIDGDSVVNGTGTDTDTTKHIGNYDGKNIVVNAYAIQAIGFDSAFHAWSTACGAFTN